MFRSLFNKKAAPQVPELLELTIGRTFTIDPVEVKLLSKDALFVAPDTALRIVAQGMCDLGEQSFLHRFYPEDDRYLLQLKGGNGHNDARVDEIVLWYVYDVQYLSRDADWKAVLSDIRKPSFNLSTETGSIQFERVWFDPASTDEDPMTYWETIHETRAVKAGSRIFQTAMLFGRGLQDGTDEMLLVNLEEPDSGERAASYLIGRALPKHAILT